MVILAYDSAETVLSVYGEAFDLAGFKGLRPRSLGPVLKGSVADLL